MFAKAFIFSLIILILDAYKFALPFTNLRLSSSVVSAYKLIENLGSVGKAYKTRLIEYRKYNTLKGNLNDEFIPGNRRTPVIILVQPASSNDSEEALVRELGKSLRLEVREANSIQEVITVSSVYHSQKSLLISIKEENAKGNTELLDSFNLLNPIYLFGEGNNSGVSAVRSACKYDLWIDSDYNKTLNRLMDLISKLRGVSPTSGETALDTGLWSHFLSLTFPSIDEAVPLLADLRKGCDAFELRVDLLEDTSAESIHRQIALLRDECSLPIVYTVRSIGQIGKFPGEPNRIFELLREGLRAGAEWVDVEACWPNEITNSFLEEAQRKYGCTSRILGSLHVTEPQNEEQIKKLYEEAALGGRADMLKVVTGAASEEDCRAVHSIGAAYAREVDRPYIGLCLGEAGAPSRVFNRVFTPVTHEKMATAAPGQLSVEQLMRMRQQQGLIEGRKLYLFGSPIQQSLSPAMHNGGFQALMLPHKYELKESLDVHIYERVLAEPSFGGASVTIPHKEAIIPFVDEVRGAACEIGAINTIIVEGEKGQTRKLVAYNTDWLGMKRPILRQLMRKGDNWREPGSFGVVAGAGGTARAACYAMKDLGLDIFVYNRSPDKGRELANKFGGRYISEAELADPSFMESWGKLQVLISTIPGGASFTVPLGVLEANQPVVLDAVYKPARTALLEQALEAGCYVVQGATMLLEQGLEQFELWNKRRAPRLEMSKAVFDGVESIEN